MAARACPHGYCPAVRSLLPPVSCPRRQGTAQLASPSLLVCYKSAPDSSPRCSFPSKDTQIGLPVIDKTPVTVVDMPSPGARSLPLLSLFPFKPSFFPAQHCQTLCIISLS